MRILVVALSNSVHVARWLSAIADQGWDVHVFPSVDNGRAYPDLAGVTIHHTIYAPADNPRQGVALRGLAIRLPAFTGRLAHYVAAAGRLVLRTLWPGIHVWRLKRLIRELQPDLVHAIEFQHAGYLVLKAQQSFEGPFPRLMVSSYGSDIYLFGRQPEHQDRIRALLALADICVCDCERDVVLAREFGFKGETAPAWPVTGGFDLPHFLALRQPGRVAGRRTLCLKGYQGWAGRSLIGLEAIARCAEALAGYRIVVIPASTEVVQAAHHIAAETGLAIETIPFAPHDDLLRVLGAARICIGLSISDGSPLTMLEAMVMGAFPIQSCTACADEWIVNGETGLIVPPEDPAAIAAAIRTALADDALVDRAAERNAQVALERLDRERLKPAIVALYRRAAQTPD